MKRVRETPEYAAFVRRSIRAHGRRVGDADPEDLAALIALRGTLEAAIAEAIRGQRANGFSWAHIGRGLGVTRQAAQMAWGRVVEQLEHEATLAEIRAIRSSYVPVVNQQDYDGDLTSFVEG